MYIKRIASTINLIIFTSVSVFAYFYISSSERSERQNYIDLQCVRKKNSTLAEARGGNTVLYAMKNAASINEVIDSSDNWVRFTSDLISNTRWNIVGGAALAEMNTSMLQEWAKQRDVTPTERDEHGGRRNLTFNRSRYLIIVEDVPNTDTLGYDYLSDPQRRDLVSNAYATGKISLSDPGLSLYGSKKAVVFFIPTSDRNNKFIGGVSTGYYTSNLVPSLANNEDVFLRLHINGIHAFENDNFDGTNLRSSQSFSLADKTAKLECGLVFFASSTPLIVLLIGILGGVIISLLISWIIYMMTRRALYDEEVRMANHNEQEAIKSASAKSMFFAGVSHELRTPMNGIMWMINFLKQTKLDDEQRELTEQLRSASQSLLQILNDVLDFSKLEAHQLSVEESPFDLNNFVDELSTSYMHQATAKNNEFVLVNKLPGPHFWILSDAARIRQILNNIVGNALKFTSNGTVTMSCDYHDGEVWFDIADTGIGIERHVLPTLFQPYVQGDVSTTRKYGGTGLGLTISKHLANVLNGDISCDSVPNRGSVFHVHVCVKIVESLHNEKTSEESQDARFSGNVLVAEDNTLNQKVIARLLEGMGLNVTLVNDGQEAVNLVVEKPEYFDCILMDGMMPVMDGYQATTQIRKHGIQIPIIALTANNASGERDRCLKIGMDDFIPKPIMKPQLVRALTNCFKSYYMTTVAPM